MTTFHPNLPSPKIKVCWVESTHQLGQILDGYANMARVPIRLLTVALTGTFQRIGGAETTGKIFFNDFRFLHGESLIETRIDGFRTLVRPIGRFDVTIEV